MLLNTVEMAFSKLGQNPVNMNLQFNLVRFMRLVNCCFPIQSIFFLIALQLQIRIGFINMAISTFFKRLGFFFYESA